MKAGGGEHIKRSSSGDVAVTMRRSPRKSTRPEEGAETPQWMKPGFHCCHCEAPTGAAAISCRRVQISIGQRMPLTSGNPPHPAPGKARLRLANPTQPSPPLGEREG